MKLLYSPGDCSIGIHIILEEIGKPFEIDRVSFSYQEQHLPDFKKVNPKSKVPVLLRDDDSVLTEFPAIATWLARTNPEANLIAEDIEGQVRALEVMEYCTATIHMQGFTRVFHPGRSATLEADFPVVRARGREFIDKGFAIMDAQLGSNDYILGEFSIADAALFYVEWWETQRLKSKLPENCTRHFNAMVNRPAVQRALADEGLKIIPVS
ncbi:MAG: glutathione S-transferase [Bradyrhizobium sp.]|nr:glutathione S-transferase [Bradyrhizobium sp.]